MEETNSPGNAVRAVVVAIEGGDVLVRIPRNALPGDIQEGDVFEFVVANVGSVAPVTTWAAVPNRYFP